MICLSDCCTCRQGNPAVVEGCLCGAPSDKGVLLGSHATAEATFGGSPSPTPQSNLRPQRVSFASMQLAPTAPGTNGLRDLQFRVPHPMYCCVPSEGRGEGDYRVGKLFGGKFLVGENFGTSNFGALCTVAGTTVLGIHSGYTKESFGIHTGYTQSLFGIHGTHNKVL